MVGKSPDTRPRIVGHVDTLTQWRLLRLRLREFKSEKSFIHLRVIRCVRFTESRAQDFATVVALLTCDVSSEAELYHKTGTDESLLRVVWCDTRELGRERMSSAEGFDAKNFAQQACISRTEVIPALLPSPAFVPGYITTADRFFQRLRSEIPWKEQYWKCMYKHPRLGYHYTVSEQEKNTNSLLEELIWIVEHLQDAKVADVWCNLYRNGNDYMEFHRDCVGKHQTTLSFGAKRTLVMKHLQSCGTCDFVVGHGDVYTWSPAIDEAFAHAIPPMRSVDEVRVSVVVWTAAPGTGR